MFTFFLILWLIFVVFSFMTIVAFGWRAKTRENKIFFITLPVTWLIATFGLFWLSLSLLSISHDEGVGLVAVTFIAFIIGFGSAMLFLNGWGLINGFRLNDEYLMAVSFMPLLFLLGIFIREAVVVVMGLYVILTLSILLRKAVRARKHKRAVQPET